MNKNNRLYQNILVSVLSSAVLLLPTLGYTMPQGGNIVTGGGSIGTPSGGQMNITGNGGNMAIDWDSFNIGRGEAVNFNNLAAVLNYVKGNQRSEIFGAINGGGAHVFLINPNGILFGASAQINVGSLTASTRTMTDDARRNFNGSLSSLSAADIASVKEDIVNLGSITANKLVLEGNNISIVSADNLHVTNNSDISLRAKGAINIGYQVTDQTTISVDDGQGPHNVADYTKGNGDKASVRLNGALTTDLSGNTKNINDCMLVNNIYELQNIHNNLDGKYMLANDIDASATNSWYNGEGFRPIGQLYSWGDATPFNGVLDGLGYSINDFYINRDTNFAAMFSQTSSTALLNNFKINGTVKGEATLVGWNYGTVSNIESSVNVSSNGSRAAGLVVLNSGIIANVANKGTIDGGAFVAGIASYNNANEGKIYNARNEGSITGTGSIGGIVGHNENGAIIDGATNIGNVQTVQSGSSRVGGIAGLNTGVVMNVNNSGKITGYVYPNNTLGVSDVGGIVGDNYEGGQIENAFNSGEVSGDNTVGGIAGANSGTSSGISSIKNSENTGKVSSKNSSVGGIAGYNNSKGIIEDVRNSGNVVTTAEQGGGIVGSNSGGTVRRATNSGTIDVTKYAGGIVGSNSAGTIDEVTNTGTVIGGTSSKQGYSGGISGYSNGTINHAVNTGSVSGYSFIGGIVGHANGGSIGNSHNGGSINTLGSAGGGIVGYMNAGTVYSSYNSGAISGTGYLGGIIGRMVSSTQDIILKNVYNTGSVTASNQVVGGIVGSIDGTRNTISSAYNTGVVTGSYTGDIVGYMKTGNTVNANNIYFINANGLYQQYGTDIIYDSTAEFNQAFVSGLDAEGQAAWKIQNATAPILKEFLQGDITADLGSLEVDANASFVDAIIARLKALGYDIDASKIVVQSGLENGKYSLGDVVYSLQDGYNLTLSGELVIGDFVEPTPTPDISGSRYEALQSELHKRKQHDWNEYIATQSLKLEPTKRLKVDGAGVKLGVRELPRVNIKEKELEKVNK